MLKTIVISSVLAALTIGTSASALTAKQTVFKEVIVPAADGSQSYERVPADKIIPGDRVVYSLAYFNDKADAAEDIVLTMPVPDAISYIDGTAQSQNATIVYSADKGASFGSRETRMVIEADGTLREARSEEITHVRWSMTRAVAPGQKGELSFTGVLK